MSDSSIKNIISCLTRGQYLSAREFALLIKYKGNLISHLAREIADDIHGRRVFVRGLLEIGNQCRNNCLYCGIRADNGELLRYRLSEDEIVESCRNAHHIGFRTFVLQGGEWPADDFMIERAIKSIHTEMPDSAVTLSLGERDRHTYERWAAAGASRYLLRHETALLSHYEQLHPSQMSLDKRMQCLRDLKNIGFQTGTGMMIGSPGQSIESLCADLAFIQELQPQMVGIGPFIPHHATPLASCSAGSANLTIRLISIIRIMLPHANIPSTTALATIHPHGRELGLMAGANVLMPNISPSACRNNYQLYDNKAAWGAESAEGLTELSKIVESAGFELDFSRGDFKTNKN